MRHLILGIETSMSVSSVALAADGQVVASRQTRAGRGHVEFLMPAILDLMRDHEASFDDVEMVAVGIGPGLFTGMRVGIVTAKTIAQTIGADVIPVTSLDNLARQARAEPGLVCACVDARRAEVFAAFYRDGEAVSEPATFAPEDLVTRARDLAAAGEPGAARPDAAAHATLFLGDGAVAYREALEPHGEVRAAQPEASVLCEIAMARGGAVSPHLVEPLYVRRSEAEIKWENRGVQPQRPDRVKIAGQR